MPGEDAADDGHGVADFAAEAEPEYDRYPRFDVGQDGAGDVGFPETEGLVSGLANGADHALRGEEIRPGGKRDRLVGRRRGGKPRDVGYRNPVVAVSGVHVPHAGPDGDLGAGADAGVLLEIRNPRDLEVYAEEVDLERRATRDGGFHVRPAAQIGAQDRPTDGRRWQRTEDAEPAVRIDR